jgi:putative nucleotidyltransferase with HDIG domain
MTVAMRTYVQHALKLPVLARCWRHSLACAVLSERLATASGLKGDIAHTAGILHDIGRLAFLVACPSDYARLLDNPKLSVNDLLAAERRMFDLDHCDAGLWLTVKWLLPNELVQPIGHHHDVEPPGEWGFTSIARLACGMAEALGFPSARLPNRVSLEDLRQELPPATRLRFDPDPAELKAELAKRIASLA